MGEENGRGERERRGDSERDAKWNERGLPIDLEKCIEELGLQLGQQQEPLPILFGEEAE
jgi:hypothetical protein